MADEAASCIECGASGCLGNCGDLFHALLALDHQRLQPWGRFHGLNVACFLLQHPSQAPAGASDGLWQMVTTFLAGGLDAVNQLESDRVRSNRRGRKPPLVVESPPPRTSAPSVTIEDVSVDGSFPASGYESRMFEWASSIAEERMQRIE
ncbi:MULTISPECIES: DUF5946 family protein [unclassified Microbacterium]|uniref:DUF5946 family protein n=1 Tax=unclassified Microbacterium TaxID=2609290 RepID=UPI0036611EF6